MSLYKFAGAENEAAALYEKAIEMQLNGWKSYFSTCEIHLPFLGAGSPGAVGSFYDVSGPALADVVALLSSKKTLFEQDLKRLLMDPLGMLNGLVPVGAGTGAGGGASGRGEATAPVGAA